MGAFLYGFTWCRTCDGDVILVVDFVRVLLVIVERDLYRFAGDAIGLFFHHLLNDWIGCPSERDRTQNSASDRENERHLNKSHVGNFITNRQLFAGRNSSTNRTNAFAQLVIGSVVR